MECHGEQAEAKTLRSSPAVGLGGDGDSGVGGAAVAFEGFQIGECLHHEQLRPAGHLKHAEVRKLTDILLSPTFLHL